MKKMSSKYLITDKGAGLGCKLALIKDDSFTPDAINQVIIDSADFPVGTADDWKIEDGVLKSDAGIVLKVETKKIKAQRDLDMGSVTVDHNSKSWSFKPVDMSRFESKISRDRDFSWKADDGTHVTLTTNQAENIAKKVDDAATQIFFDAETAISNL